MKFAIVSAVGLMLATPALSDTTDRLPEHRITAISVAVAMALEDPEMNTERLSPARLEVMAAAYETHDPQPDADRIPHSRWVAMQTAYETHGTQADEIASSSALIDDQS